VKYCFEKERESFLVGKMSAKCPALVIRERSRIKTPRSKKDRSILRALSFFARRARQAATRDGLRPNDAVRREGEAESARKSGGNNSPRPAEKGGRKFSSDQLICEGRREEANKEEEE